MLVERYLLGELNEREAGDFEEHYFDCRDCADAVRNGATFIDSGKSAVRKAETRKRIGMSWFPSAVAAVLAVVVGYQAFLISRTHVPDEPSATSVTFVPLQAGTRAEAEETVVTRERGKPAVVTFDIVSDTQYPKYRWEIRDGSGASRAGESVSAEVASKPVPVQLSRALPAGRYEVVVEGVPGDGKPSEIARFPFVVKQAE